MLGQPPTPMLGGNCLLIFLALDELLLEGQTLSLISLGMGAHGAQAKAIFLERMAQQNPETLTFRSFTV